MSTEFFQTVMGRHFYESIMPRVSRDLGRIADALESIASVKTLARLEVTKAPNSSRELTISYGECNVLIEGAWVLDTANGTYRFYDNRGSALRINGITLHLRAIPVKSSGGAVSAIRRCNQATLDDLYSLTSADKPHQTIKIYDDTCEVFAFTE